MKIYKLAKKYDIVFDYGEGSRKVGESEGNDAFAAISRFWRDNPEYSKDRLFAEKHDDSEEKLLKQYNFLKDRYNMSKTYEEWLASRRKKKDLQLRKKKKAEEEGRQRYLF